MIEDIDTDLLFTPHRAIAASAGFRAVQSTPLISRSGALLGILSTHFRRPHRLSQAELRMLERHTRRAADMIEQLIGPPYDAKI